MLCMWPKSVNVENTYKISGLRLQRGLRRVCTVMVGSHARSVWGRAVQIAHQVFAERALVKCTESKLSV